MATPESDSDAESPTLYELWRFSPKINTDHSISWSSPKRELIPSNQETLEYTVETTEREKPVEVQYQFLPKKLKGAIGDLIAEHNQWNRRFEWTCVYIKTGQRRVNAAMISGRDITVKMDVIIARNLRPQVMPVPAAFKNKAADLTQPQNPGNPSGFVAANPAFEGIGIKTSHPQMAGNPAGTTREQQMHANSLPNTGMPQTHAPMHFPRQPPGHP